MALWDVGGQEMLRTFWRHHFRGTDCVIFVIDSTDTERFAQARKQLHAVAAEAELDRAVFLVLANKRDMPDAMDFDTLVRELYLGDLICVKEKPTIPMDDCVRVMPVSALTGTGVTDAMEWMADAIERRDKRLTKP